MLKRTVSLSLVFVICFICFIALTTPPASYVYKIENANDKLLDKLSAKDIYSNANCQVETDGTVKIINEDAFIIFKDLPTGYKSVVLNFSENSDGRLIQIFYSDDSGIFIEENSIWACVPLNETTCVIPIESDNYTQLRIDIDEDYQLLSLELHEGAAQLVKENSETNVKNIILCFFGALLISIVFLAIDIKYDYTNKSIRFITENRKVFLEVAIAIILCGLLSVLIEYLISNFFISSATDTYNLYRLVYIFGIVACCSVFVIFRKEIAENPEKLFLFASLIICAMMVIICPFGHTSPDVDYHYKWVLNASFLGKKTYFTLADTRITAITLDYWSSKDWHKAFQKIILMNDYFKQVAYVSEGSTTIAHLPSGLFFALCRLFKRSFYETITICKYANSLVYCFVCYFAMKKLKSGKMILAVVAMMPTALYLASNYAYDYWTNCFSILGMAYFVGTHQEKNKKITTAETIIMCASFAVACLPKLVYVFLLLIPLFIKHDKIANKKKYYSICVISIIIIIGLFALTATGSLSGGGDARGGSNVNSVEQLKFIISNPLKYTKILANFLIQYFSINNVKNYSTDFAYLGNGVGAYTIVALMVLTLFTDKKKCDIKAYSLWSRAAVIGLFIGGCALIATALYISFTDVGKEKIDGCQARYLIPLIYPLLSISGIGFDNKINRKFYNAAILLSCITINIYNIAIIMLSYWTK